MIHTDKIIGNINSDSNLKDKYQAMLRSDQVELIDITRIESERSRLRKISDRGTDLALTLIPGSHINDGDVVLMTEEKMVIAKRVPESVAIVSLRNIAADQLFDIAIKLGHTIGNMHRPIKITDSKIYFPIQSASEIELFQKLFSKLRAHINIKQENIIFDADAGYDIHEH